MLSELKKLSKHTIIYGTGTFLTKAIGFFLIPLYTHYLTPKDYGVLTFLDLTEYIISYFLILGLAQAILRYYYEYKEPSEKNSVISTAILFCAIYNPIFLTFLYFFNKTFSRFIFGSPNYYHLLNILLINLFFGTMLCLMKTTLRAQQKSILFTIISVIQTLIALSLNIYFVAFLKIGVKGILYSTLITSLIVSFSLSVYLFREIYLFFKLSKLKKMLRYGVPFIFVFLSAFILNWSDRYFLRIYCGMEIVGLYALAYKIAMIITIIITGPFDLIWGAYMFEIFQRPNAEKIFAKIATYYFLIIFFMGTIISIYARDIITIIAPSSYLEAYKVIPILVLSMIFMTSGLMLRVGILVSKKTIYLAITVGVAAIINIFLNLALIPVYKMDGAALATAISFLIRSIGIYLISQRLYFIHFEHHRVIKIIIASIITFIACSSLHIENLWMSIILKSLSIPLFLFFLCIMGFLENEEKNAIRQLYLSLSRIKI